MSLLLALAVAVVIPILAANGKAYRGVYGAVALSSIVVALFTFGLMGSVGPNPTESEQLGQAIVNEYGPPLIFLLIGCAIGGVLGAMLYRPPAQPQHKESV